jgi:hypothetical protein
MANMPDYDVSLRGEEYAPKKYKWTKIGVAWANDNGLISLKIEFPANFTINPETKITLYPIKEEKPEEPEF